MNSEVCQCPGCICELDDSAVRRGDQFFCCQACADGHHQERACRDPECPCTDRARQNSSDSQLDHSLEETFPASDPISP
ncbi:metallothionein [Pseudomonas sp. ZM23]|uniref:Metallothionein n=1 Tax=Pseudomonas triclosanedens TaxID=2961893 RepID=A0ABY7A5G0_9PSED|nr:metallothionein [Pseudomonas triclosanedens]MCP8466239.1 metallothionein [Pseudomonas triclosanedens]MCP8471765.1 metallothionein [Pseudomonas triclosanedens]MCP8478882.1 metallothionein [Pseudomonas triclosanedens]WAI52343.1 metallothionein [Pseudomonas triclosanedens]